MITLFFIILCVALFHFIYEGIIIPSVRLYLRYRLFKLRDRVRWLTITERTRINESLLSYLQNAINNSINLMPIFDLRTLYLAFSSFRNNPDFEKRSNEVNKLIENHSTPETKAIIRKNNKIFTYALLANSGVMFVYAVIFILPFLFLLGFLKTIKLVIKGILSTPESKIEQLVAPYNISVS